MGFAITHTGSPHLRRTLLDERSARHKDLYLTTHNRQKDTNFRTQNSSKRAAADPRGWQLNNIVNYPLVLSATGVIHIMLNQSLNNLTLPPCPMSQVQKVVTQTKIVIMIIIIIIIIIIIQKLLCNNRRYILPRLCISYFWQ